MVDPARPPDVASLATWLLGANVEHAFLEGQERSVCGRVTRAQVAPTLSEHPACRACVKRLVTIVESVVALME